MKKLNSCFLALVSVLLAPALPTAAQTADPTFAQTSFRGPGAAASVAAQPDGKRVIVGGNFTLVNGTPLSGVNSASNISRLNADGSLDAAFQQNVGISSGNFLRVRQLPSGQLLLTANSINSPIMTAGGISRREPLRLNADGTGDATFDVGDGAKPAVGGNLGRVADMQPLPDGRLIVVGAFGSFNNVPAFGIARLTATGAVDASFNAGLGLSSSAANAAIATITALPDGKLLIGGNFTSYNGNACNSLARLNADGSFDPTFGQALGAGSRVGNAAVTAEGRILIAGTLTGIPNSTRLARLLPTGAYDPSFTPSSSTANTASVTGESVLVQADNKVVFINGATITRLNANGTTDFSFLPSFIPAADAPSSLAQLPNGNVLVAGSFNSLDDGVVELTGTGEPAATFKPLLQRPGFVRAVVRQTDGKLLVAGDFSAVNGQRGRRLVRFNADGTLDASYSSASTGLDYPVADLTLDLNGRALVATAGGVRRFLTTGAADNSLTTPVFGGGTTRLLVQPDGRILVGGTFTSVGSVAAPGFVRLLPTGAHDNLFAPAVGSSGTFTTFRTFGLQPDGKVLVAGRFIPAGGTASSAINTVARLESSGALDETFVRGSFNPNSFQTNFTQLVVQPDDKILVAGAFTDYNGTPRPNLARLNATGSLDAGFVPPAMTGGLNKVVLQPNNRILIGGFFSGGGLPANLGRLLPDGQADASFAATAAPNSSVSALLIEPDGGLVIGGFFTTVGGEARQSLARLTAPNVLYAAAPRAVAERTAAWPVPARGTLFVAPAPTAHPQALELLDALGRTVRQQPLRPGDAPAQVSVETLPAGLYLLRVRYAEGTVSRRVQVQK